MALTALNEHQVYRRGQTSQSNFSLWILYWSNGQGQGRKSACFASIRWAEKDEQIMQAVRVTNKEVKREPGENKLLFVDALIHSCKALDMFIRI